MVNLKMNISNLQLTNQTRDIIKNKKGYRNDYLFDGDNFLIMDVIAYETEELQNTDIFEFTKSQYAINNLEIKNWLESLFKMSTKNLYGYWYASKKGIELYIDNPENELITELKLPKKYVILSDLGYDGCLIATDTPKSIITENAKTCLLKEL